jgi:uncharacterized RDD family membrane protein YckC
MPFLDSKKTTDISDDMFNLIQKYNAKEINEEEYLIDLENIQYKLARTTEIYSIFLILVSVLYYVVLPLYYNGRTLGKKLMKLKITSTDKELTANQLIIRSFICNGVIFNIISVLLLMFSPRSIFVSLNGEINLIKFLIMCVSIGTIIITKQGLTIHDMLAHTKVINYKEN